MSLSAVVLAHQQGLGVSAYKRQQEESLQRPINASYELRGEKRRFRGGTERIVWSAWRIGIESPFRVYDVVSSTYPQAVKDDLKAWLAGL